MLFLPVLSSNQRRKCDSLGDVPPLAVKQAMRPLAPSGLGCAPSHLPPGGRYLRGFLQNVRSQQVVLSDYFSRLRFFRMIARRMPASMMRIPTTRMTLPIKVTGLLAENRCIISPVVPPMSGMV